MLFLQFPIIGYVNANSKTEKMKKRLDRKENNEEKPKEVKQNVIFYKHFLLCSNLTHSHHQSVIVYRLILMGNKCSFNKKLIFGEVS